MNNTKQRQYAHLAQQLEELNQNLKETTRHLDTMSKQCNENLVGQLGKVNSSWLIGSSRCFEDQMLGGGENETGGGDVSTISILVWRFSHAF